MLTPTEEVRAYQIAIKVLAGFRETGFHPIQGVFLVEDSGRECACANGALYKSATEFYLSLSDDMRAGIASGWDGFKFSREWLDDTNSQFEIGYLAGKAAWAAMEVPCPQL